MLMQFSPTEKPHGQRCYAAHTFKPAVGDATAHAASGRTHNLDAPALSHSSMGLSRRAV